MAHLPQRRPPPGWTRPVAERLTPTITALVATLTLGYFSFVLAPPIAPWMQMHLLLGPAFARGELWQPLTALVFEDSFLGWLFGVIGLWWVGAFVERVRGRRFFLALYIGAGLLANVVAGVVMALSPAYGAFPRGDGAGFALTAVFVAFARIYGPRPAQIWGMLSMRADHFTWILVGFSLVMGLARADFAFVAAELAAIAVALAATGTLRDLRQRWQERRVRRRYRVLDGGAGGAGSRRKKKPGYLN
jgi:membrane associated rhomboid family serine protease